LVDQGQKEYDDLCVEKVKKVLLDSCDFTWKEIRSSRRKTSLTFCRLVFGYHLDKFGVGKERIAQELNRCVCTVFYYPEQYTYERDANFLKLAKIVKYNLGA
jgi:hypothetical protein